MKILTLPRLLASGFILSLMASLMMPVLSVFLSASDAFDICLSITSLVYLFYLLKQSDLKAGQISLTIGTLLLISVFLLTDISSEVLLAFLLLLIFVSRAFYFYRNIALIICDGLLIGVGVFVAYAVLIISNSWFLCFWSFFFIQAMMVFIPGMFNFETEQSFTITPVSQPNHNQGFHQAANTANQAIQQISAIKPWGEKNHEN